jgi:uncharacterized membrane protein
MADIDSHSHTARLETFSDGVFAIAITLLIIEIGVPKVEAGQSLSHELGDLWPEYLAYVLSFVSIGIYWANHHSFFRLFHSTDHWFLLANIFFLMTIAFLPFPTAVLGEYLGKSEFRHTAVSFYAFGLMLPAVGWCTVWLVGRHQRLLDEDLDPRYVTFATWQYIASVAIYGVAFAASFLNEWAGLAIAVGITAVYLLPPRRAQYIVRAVAEGTP